MHGGIEEEGVSVLQCYSVSVYQLGYVRCTVSLVKLTKNFFQHQFNVKNGVREGFCGLVHFIVVGGRKHINILQSRNDNPAGTRSILEIFFCFCDQFINGLAGRNDLDGTKRWFLYRCHILAGIDRHFGKDTNIGN